MLKQLYRTETAFGKAEIAAWVQPGYTVKADPETKAVHAAMTAVFKDGIKYEYRTDGIAAYLSTVYSHKAGSSGRAIITLTKANLATIVE